MTDLAVEEQIVNLLHADPHPRGPGKIHVWDDDEAKTLCGRTLIKCPGEIVWSGHIDTVSCKLCVNSWQSAKRREEQERQAQERNERYLARTREDDRRFWAKYNAYLLSPEWAHKRKLVLKRAGGICEGCGERPATIVHHVSYEHVFDEFLWELRAVCQPCHDRAHPNGGGPRW